MIELFIFHFHIIGALYAFVKQWQKSNVREGLMMVIVIGLVFTIVWALANPIAKLLYPSDMKSEWFRLDTLSLLIAFCFECVFYYFYVLKDKAHSR